jgi:3-hydroxy-9,10-secoandrosta-1,3,5(10)-triene-9,17-dione monooxygenase reductase component
VSILGEEHTHVSSQMAGFTDIPDGEDRFYGLDWEAQETGSPIFTGANGWLDCKVYDIYDGGTHHIVVGEVIAAGRNSADGKPLLYFNSGYRQLHVEQEQAEY